MENKHSTRHLTVGGKGTFCAITIFFLLGEASHSVHYATSARISHTPDTRDSAIVPTVENTTRSVSPATNAVVHHDLHVTSLQPTSAPQYLGVPSSLIHVRVQIWNARLDGLVSSSRGDVHRRCSGTAQRRQSCVLQGMNHNILGVRPVSRGDGPHALDDRTTPQQFSIGTNHDRLLLIHCPLHSQRQEPGL
jgi:hypothetical protein